MVVLKIDYPDGGPPFSMANTKAAVARLRSALAKDAYNLLTPLQTPCKLSVHSRGLRVDGSNIKGSYIPSAEWYDLERVFLDSVPGIVDVLATEVLS